MKTSSALLAALILFAGCAGITPTTDGQLEPNLAAVIISARIKTPNGHAYSGGTTLTLQGIGEGSSKSYRIFLPAQETLLYQIAPGLYRVEAPRGFFGNLKTILSIQADGENYVAPFPRGLVDLPPIQIKPEQTVAIGKLEVAVMSVPAGTPQSIVVEFHHDIAAKRRLIEKIIHSMADPNISEDKRRSYQSWVNSLQNALISMTETVNDSFEKPQP
jgi:hypothetical protein